MEQETHRGPLFGSADVHVPERLQASGALRIPLVLRPDASGRRPIEKKGGFSAASSSSRRDRPHDQEGRLCGR
jgi:hypothetical protein